MTKRVHTRKQFTTDEDIKLATLVHQYGDLNWYKICEFMPGRNVRQVKERWNYFLSPKINKAPWTTEDDSKLMNGVFHQKDIYSIYGVF